MIPKILHYCWFGGKEKPAEVERYIQTWKTVMPDYEIMEWNERRFDIDSSSEYVKQAYAEKKWAFVSDYVRLHALYHYGGIYLDSDVEVLKPFNSLLNGDAFIGAESEYSICTATIGAEPGARFIAQILELYKDKTFLLPNGKMDTTPNSQLIYAMLKEQENYSWSDKPVRLRDCMVYPAEYFSPINCYTMKCNITEETFSIHRYTSTWKSPVARMKDKIMRGITRIIGEKNREKIKRFVKR